MVNMCTRPIWTPKQEDHHHGEYVHPPNLDLKQEDIHQGEYVQRLNLKQEDHQHYENFDLDLKQKDLHHGEYVRSGPKAKESTTWFVR